MSVGVPPSLCLTDVAACTDFSGIVAVVGLIFCFFVLWLSFTANMRDNSWEFGVLRALGFPVLLMLTVTIWSDELILIRYR